MKPKLDVTLPASAREAADRSTASHRLTPSVTVAPLAGQLDTRAERLWGERPERW